MLTHFSYGEFNMCYAENLRIFPNAFSTSHNANMKKNPLVSVIIPTWNRADMVKTALDSVFSQNYDNLEVIVVDDGSTDHTRDVLSLYPAVFSFFLSKHTGQCSTRNLGIDESQGKYIQLLDSDDALPPGIIKKHVEFLEANPDIDFVYGDLVKVNNYVLDNPSIKQDPSFKPDVRKGTPIDFDMKKVLLQNLNKPYNSIHSILTLFVPTESYFKISTGTGLFRKTLVRYDPIIEQNWNCSADVDFWGQLIMDGFKFAYLPGHALECREHSDNVTNHSGLHTKTRREVRQYIYNKLKQQSLNGM